MMQKNGARSPCGKDVSTALTEMSTRASAGSRGRQEHSCSSLLCLAQTTLQSNFQSLLKVQEATLAVPKSSQQIVELRLPVFCRLHVNDRVSVDGGCARRMTRQMRAMTTSLRRTRQRLTSCGLRIRRQMHRDGLQQPSHYLTTLVAIASDHLLHHTRFSGRTCEGMASLWGRRRSVLDLSKMLQSIVWIS